MRSSTVNSKEYTSFTFPGLIWQQRTQNKQDIYLGAYCDLFNPSAVYGNPFRGTISRLYIWANIAIDGIIDNDLYLDKYFFRIASSSASPVCTPGTITNTQPDLVPCKFCVVGYNPPTGFTTATTLTCLPQTMTVPQMYIAYWDFNDPTVPATQKSIPDSTGNGYQLYKGSPSVVSNDPFRIWGQGYLFEMGMFAVGGLPIFL